MHIHPPIHTYVPSPQVWNISNRRNASGLNADDFNIALRLVSMAQQGLPVTKESFAANLHRPLPLPEFEGITSPTMAAPSAPAPAPAPSAAPPTGPLRPLSIDPALNEAWAISAADLQKYKMIFQQQDVASGYLAGAPAVALFTRSGLEKAVLKNVWSMCDWDNDGRLDVFEFCAAMHLVVGVSKRNLALPDMLPAVLVPASKVRVECQGAGFAILSCLTRCLRFLWSSETLVSAAGAGDTSC